MQAVNKLILLIIFAVLVPKLVFGATQITLTGTALSAPTSFRTIAAGEGLGLGIYNHFGNTVDTATKLCALTGQYYQILGLDKPYPIYVKKTSGTYASCWNDHNHVWKNCAWVTEGACKIGSMLNSVTCESTAPPPPIVCSTNAQCGTNAYVGSPLCQSGNVYQDFKTYTCSNPGTANSACSDSTALQLKQTCSSNQICQSGQCVDQTITCASDSACGANGFTGNPFCGSGGDVYRNFRTFTCHNSGTPASYCANSNEDRLVADCTNNQTCSAGSCQNQNIACSTSADCGANAYEGSPFCQGNSVYKNFRTYTCSNPGTANSSCSSSVNPQLQNTCASNQTCNNGSCADYNNLVVSSYATPNPANVNQQVSFIATATGGTGNYIYSWTGDCAGSGQVCNTTFSTSGTHTVTVTVTSGSQTNTSVATVVINQNCAQQSERRCDNSSVYWYDSCGNRDGLIQYCQYGCSNGYCNNQTCTAYSYQQCSGSYLYWYNSCGTQEGQSQYCQYGCSGNTCNNNNCASQSNRRCDGNSIYWYDSCGNRDGLIETCNYNQTCQNGYCQNNNYANLTTNVTVKNLTTGSGWSNYASASPSDMLMFMITLQAQGNQNTSNIFARDILPYGLIYRNNLIASGSNNYNYNYNGDITSGINVGTISAGQTVTITYQAQVAPASNFNYGISAMTDNVSITTSGNTPSVSNATVAVTKTAVYGATSISTGLTNNLLVDSFFLPLMLALLGLWMFRSGIFGIEKWADTKKAAVVSYKAQKLLSARIAKIRQQENI